MTRHAAGWHLLQVVEADAAASAVAGDVDEDVHVRGSIRCTVCVMHCTLRLTTLLLPCPSRRSWKACSQGCRAARWQTGAVCW